MYFDIFVKHKLLIDMKSKITSFSALTLLVSFSFSAFAQKIETYKVDVAKSIVTWEGKKFSGAHSGTVNLNTGNLDFQGKNLKSGGFTVNMNTIKDIDGNAKLEGHLKADDFFGVEKFPTSSFVIKKIQSAGTNLNITGDLTIKGKTNSISFPAKITWNADKTVTATADKITIDRTRYGIEYKSKSIFSSIGDNFIYDDFALTINLTAKK